MYDFVSQVIKRINQFIGYNKVKTTRDLQIRDTEREKSSRGFDLIDLKASYIRSLCATKITRLDCYMITKFIDAI